MVYKKTIGGKIFDCFNIVFLTFLVLITVYPVLHVIFASFSNPKLLLMHEGLIYWPLGETTLKGYEIVFKNPNIVNGFRNSVFYVVVGTAINLFFTGLGAYVLSRKDFYIKKAMMIMIVITMFFHGGLIPTFMLIKNLRMYNTVWSILIPNAINVFNIIIMRTFFQSLPVSLEESAVIDGANDFIVFWKIVLPLSKPVIAVMILYYGVAHWNSWFGAMIYLRDRKLWPIQLFLREVLIENNTEMAVETSADMLEESYYKELIKYCTSVVATVPILCIYPFLQKYFVKGVMIGAIKG